jgi:hypothetical protein
MMQTAEQIIESLRALPLSEREKFFDLAEEEKTKILSEREAKNIELEMKNERFRRALRWIEEHKEEFDGQWVCLDGDNLIAHGFDGKKVYEEAKSKGIETPFLERVKAKELPFGGW